MSRIAVLFVFLSQRRRVLSEILLLALLGFFALSAIYTWHFGYGWHEQQRVYQLLLLVLSIPLAFLCPRSGLDRRALLMLFGILALGGCSSLLAVYSEWALKEWARYAGLFLLVVLLGSLARHTAFQRAVLWGMVIIGTIHAWQFLAAYLMAFITGIRMLDPYLLFSGFANPRFFGQFQMLLLPVLAVLSVQLYGGGGRGAWFLFAVLIVQWCIAHALAGRGLWIGLLVGHLALLWVCPRMWRLIATQLMAALAGLVLLLVLFKLIPVLLGFEQLLNDGLRTDLSKRELLWQSAWDMAIANPWLGVGPMHFSAVYNPIAAHPHQVVLQWLAEWGAAATLLASVLATWGVLHGVTVLRGGQAESVDAALWLAIVGALLLAQVDGVFVMPYTETWLAVLIGLALARWGRPVAATRAESLAMWILALPVVFILGRVLLLDVTVLPEMQESYQEKHSVGWAPRFWFQGWIPMADAKVK